MPMLPVNNAILHYEVKGEGAMLLLISGANGESTMYAPIAEQLSNQYKVVTYDRRGFSQSPLTGEQDYAKRLQTDADDAAALIDALSDGKPAFVLGNSSGAIVSMQLLISYPEKIHTLIAHEPPTLYELGKEEAQMRIEKQHTVYQMYRDKGLVSASKLFLDDIAEVDKGAMGKAGNQFAQANSTYWFEREMLVYPFNKFDKTKLISVKDKLIMGAGKASDNTYAYRLALIWAQTLDVPVANLAGGHVGFATHPMEFAKDLRQALANR